MNPNDNPGPAPDELQHAFRRRRSAQAQRFDELESLVRRQANELKALKDELRRKTKDLDKKQLDLRQAKRALAEEERQHRALKDAHHAEQFKAIRLEGNLLQERQQRESDKRRHEEELLREKDRAREAVKEVEAKANMDVLDLKLEHRREVKDLKTWLFVAMLGAFAGGNVMAKQWPDLWNRLLKLVEAFSLMRAEKKPSSVTSESPPNAAPPASEQPSGGPKEAVQTGISMPPGGGIAGNVEDQAAAKPSVLGTDLVQAYLKSQGSS